MKHHGSLKLMIKSVDVNRFKDRKNSSNVFILYEFE